MPMIYDAAEYAAVILLYLLEIMMPVLQGSKLMYEVT